MANRADLLTIAEAIAFFVCTIKSGETWSVECESIRNAASDALSRMASAPEVRTVSTQEFVKGLHTNGD